MNDLQKKLFIVGLTAFIVWFFMAFDNDAIQSLFLAGDIERFISRGIYGYNTDWYHTLTFTIWIGSLIAFNVYKD